MKLSELRFDYPEELVAQDIQRPSRILLSRPNENTEITKEGLFALFKNGDVLVINNTKVEARRIFAKSESGQELEVLFVEKLSELEWQVLFPSRQLKKNEKILLPEGVRAELIAKGRPQTLKLSRPLVSEYFSQYGEMPLPPYIQKARGERHNKQEDKLWYQTQWAKNLGSSAAPTASLHFTHEDLKTLRQQGVLVCELTLHVGLGTYLPVAVDDLDQHEMHAEYVEIPKETLGHIQTSKGRVWALGTTVTRALESHAQGLLKSTIEGGMSGHTKLLIQEGYQFKCVTGLLTNFHQPESTLLALVCGFAGQKRVLEAYKFAIEKRFRLFSYGDLSVWLNN